ncbi:hypothetical protein BKA62DRAFT_834634 [Auriculariales sp. MPI-PUGE-AT-0066]|nr:hypothetical protein BKA62DRAFT_834634 [Auriculariales sp. MPI-PUGE-AT-0066]
MAANQVSAPHMAPSTNTFMLHARDSGRHSLHRRAKPGGLGHTPRRAATYFDDNVIKLGLYWLKLRVIELKWQLTTTTRSTRSTRQIMNLPNAPVFELASSRDVDLATIGCQVTRFKKWIRETCVSIGPILGHMRSVPVEHDPRPANTKHFPLDLILSTGVSLHLVAEPNLYHKQDDGHSHLVRWGLQLLAVHCTFSTWTTPTLRGRVIVSSKPASISLFYALLIGLGFVISTASAAFTRDALYHLDQIRPNPTGTYCFYPRTLPGRLTSCFDHALSALLDIHVNNARGSGLSILYYDTFDFTVLGGAHWKGWNTTRGQVGVCLSGAIEGIDGSYLTICRFAAGDDDHSSPPAQALRCAIDRPQQRVVDGCYAPPRGIYEFKLNGPTEAAFAIVGLALAVLTPACAVLRWMKRRNASSQRSRHLD